MNKSSTSIAVGANETLTATVDNTITGTSSVTWDSSDTTIATVNASGKVVGVAAGEAVITGTSGSYADICVVTVTAGA